MTAFARPVIRYENGAWRVSAPPYTDRYLIDKAVQWALKANRSPHAKYPPL